MTAERDEILRVEGLGIRFGGLVAVNDVAFTVRRGEVFGLLGPNGAGKTTLFNLIAGALRPTSGRIWFEGRDVTRLGPDRRSRRGIARTFQITQPFAELTVEENVMAAALVRHRSLAEMRAAAGPFVEMVGLAHKRHALAKELSTGQRKRLELARAMATGPRLLLLDEVTGGVDQASIPGLIDLVARLRAEGMTLILVEHNMRVIMRLSDRMMFLNRGEKLAEGPPDAIAAHPDVVGLYLGAAHA
ncbi:MAG: ABC transporter ATP-binding protein [Alphaproteobacteria bacterium]|nr:ABC transporter ATP-binding protein [Alphaproteobacteria bacterium]